MTRLVGEEVEVTGVDELSNRRLAVATEGKDITDHQPHSYKITLKMYKNQLCKPNFPI